MPSLHHATILEMNGDSYRRRTAASRQSPEAVVPPTTSSDNIGVLDPDNFNDKHKEANAE